ncbi:hypothetical protein HCUR_00246 [Holospora curviuscula]|uniref:Uncharacterized protein n=1 Tax=Holospora curviuscula TaxID=1082868 RepID=A0A2S5RE82_9PROT|nr:hypothetical protein HCUR_00246 [Holospora curviuscula]
MKGKASYARNIGLLRLIGKIEEKQDGYKQLLLPELTKF